MVHQRITLPAVILFAVFLACDRTQRAKPPAQDTSPKGTMRDMPGMGIGGGYSAAGRGTVTGKIQPSLAMTAAEIAHGHIAWAAATTSYAFATATLPGQLAPDEDHTVRLGAPAQGRVMSVGASPGDKVQRGRELVVLQSAEATGAQSDVSKASAELTSKQAQAAYAKAARARAERLLALKAIPRQDVDRAIADDELAQSNVRQAEAELQRAKTRATQLGAEGGGGDLIIRSPQSGTVLSRTAVPGAVVDAGAPLMAVTDPSRLWLVVNAPEQFAALFRNGGQLRFSVPAYPDTFSATITAIGAGLDQETRTLPVRGVIDNRGDRLKPGMLATVVVAGAPRASTVTLPEDAIELIEEKPTVFVVEPDGKGGARFTRRLVEPGARTGHQVIVARGLSAGELVVTSGAFAVKSAFQKGGIPKMEM